jgi:hypothetical protein
LYNAYGIRTLIRIGYYDHTTNSGVKPSTAEVDALNIATAPPCSQISGLMKQIDGEALGVAGSALAEQPKSVYAFILGNEPNLAGEWGLSGKAYAYVYSCYRLHWSTLTTLKAYPLLAAGPGGCNGIGACTTFYDQFRAAAVTSPIDGFAIHAYGSSSTFVTGSDSQGFAAQIAWINQIKKNVQVFITEYNTGAKPGQNLPPPAEGNWDAYFHNRYSEVLAYSQVKGLLYFPDSPNSWIRTSDKPVTNEEWAKASLRVNGAVRTAWKAAQ